MTTHTPGPWEYWDSYDGKGQDPVKPCPHCGESEMAWFSIPGGHGDGECAMYTKADARLIAAAPDLLAACEAVLGPLSRLAELKQLEDAWANQVRAAVTKAVEA